MADLAWFELFQDDALRELIQSALIQNYDLQIATARVLQARAQVGIVRSQLFPTISGGGSLETSRFSQNATNFPPGINPRLAFGGLFSRHDLGSRRLGPDPSPHGVGSG